MSNLKSYRSCFVPLFTNTTKTTPEKMFLNVPQDEKRRKKWFQAVLRDNPKTKSNFFCCEDHFDVLNSPQPKSKLGPTTQIEPFKDDSLMKPIEPEVLDILYKCSDNLGSEKYLKARYRKKTEERYHLRLSTTWDYGWELKKSVVSPRDVNYGRCAVIKGSFYRTKNLAPDPWYYNEPTMGDPTFCK